MTSPAQAEEDIAGSGEYLRSCAACHGVGGRGDGPVAQHLNVKPTDLTQLAQKNDGQFPFLKVFQTIDGRALTTVHGSRTMPIWGFRYQAEEVEDAVGGMGREQVVRGRILELANYLVAIQQPGGGETIIQEDKEQAERPTTR